MALAREIAAPAVHVHRDAAQLHRGDHKQYGHFQRGGVREPLRFDLLSLRRADMLQEADIPRDVFELLKREWRIPLRPRVQVHEIVAAFFGDVEPITRGSASQVRALACAIRAVNTSQNDLLGQHAVIHSGPTIQLGR